MILKPTTSFFKQIKNHLILLLLLPLTTVNSVQLSHDNSGDAIIFQYYTASKWQTFIRLINDSDDALALKVRFRDAANGRPTLDFIVLLSPHDEWIAWTDDTAINGKPGLRTFDSSCIISTTPYPSNTFNGFTNVGNFNGNSKNIKATSFVSYSFTGNYNDQPIPQPESNIKNRLSEGLIEIISIASIAPSLSNPAERKFVEKITNNPSTGIPTDCAGARHIYTHNLKDNELDPLQNKASQYDAKNKLIANAYLVNINSGQGASYTPITFKNFSNVSLIAESTLTAMKPDLDSANSDNWSNMSRLTQQGKEGRIRTTGGVDEISKSLMRTSITNEWASRTTTNTDSIFKSNLTQWVVTFPTKQFYVDLQHDSDLTDDISPTLTNGSSHSDAWPPFIDKFLSTNNAGKSCYPFNIDFRNIEGGASSYSSSNDLCYQTNVLTFGEEFSDRGLDSNFQTIIPSSFFPLDSTGSNTATLGHAHLSFESHPSASFTDDHNITYHGLPVDGFMLYNFEATNQNSNYTTAQSHAYTRETTVTP